MFCDDMFPFRTICLEFFASALVVRQIYLWYLFSSTLYSNLNTTTTTTTTTNNNNNNNNNDNIPDARKYWVDVQQGIISSYGERDPL